MKFQQLQQQPKARTKLRTCADVYSVIPFCLRILMQSMRPSASPFIVPHGYRRKAKTPFSLVMNLMVPGPQQLALAVTWAAEQAPQAAPASESSMRRDSTSSAASPRGDSESEAGGAPFDLLLARFASATWLSRQMSILQWTRCAIATWGLEHLDRTLIAPDAD